ncbi:MAG: histidinol-phosphatase [Nitrososphaerales archaeon]
MFDYQNHSTFSDGDGTIIEICQAADERKLREICITDHIILLKGWPYNIKNIDAYFRAIEEAQANVKVKVRIGAEIDYFEDKERQIEEILNDYAFDYILGSTHFLGPENLELNHCAIYKNKSQIETYRIYFAKWEKAVSSQLFDAMAHPDYVRRWAVPFYGSELEFSKYKELVENTCHFIADNDLGIDVNCSGFRHNLKSTYPSKDFLELCKKIGVKNFVPSSDSHTPPDVGSNLEKGMEILKRVGIDEITTFGKRKPTYHYI